MEEMEIRRWTAKKKAALAMEILRGQTTGAESARSMI